MSVNILAEAESENSKITGTGLKTLKGGANNYSIVVTSEDGVEKTYKVVIIVLIIIVALFKDFRSFLYAFAIVDIVLRIINFVCSQIAEVNDILGNFPASIAGMITAESSGTLETVLLWVYVALYILFLSYLIPSFFRKKRK